MRLWKGVVFSVSFNNFPSETTAEFDHNTCGKQGGCFKIMEQLSSRANALS